eukprot:gene17603-19356_t
MYSELGQNGGGYGGYGYQDEGSQGNGYGHSYQSYHRQNDSLKGKIEQKYWKTKQKVLEKFKKDQDEFVVAGDADVDARLEAYKHINLTCSQLMMATEAYQNRIFALSQDENEMGRFLRDQGAIDKTKAGKMMIAVGKAQSYAAQQRLSLRLPLVRLYQELETFRFRAISDTTITVEKMEGYRTEYRAGLLWMAEVSKELDPDVNKRLDKFRDVQIQVKENKKKFEKYKADVSQKIDLLSASRCNLLSATLAAYQQCMLKFLEQTTKTYQSVMEQFKGHPSYQFSILKHIMPNNGIADDDEDDLKSGRRKSKEMEQAEEATEKNQSLKQERSRDNAKDYPKRNDNDDDDDDKLISFDMSVEEDKLAKIEDKGAEETTAEKQDDTRGLEEQDLLGIFDGTQGQDPQQPGTYGAFESSDTANAESGGFEDLLGGLSEAKGHVMHAGGLGGLVTENKGVASENGAQKASGSVDELLFGITGTEAAKEKSDLDILGDILGSTSLNENAYLADNQSEFSKEWRDMFGDQQPPVQQEDIQPIDQLTTKTEGGMYMPSFLMEQLRQVDPQAAKGGPQSMQAVESEKKPGPASSKAKDSKSKKDMSAWFNLFSDLDPLANPDAIGTHKDEEQERSC